MIKTMIAKYPGKCAHTSAPIYPGDEIQYDTASRKAWLSEPGDLQAEAAHALDIDPDLDHETAASVGRYMARAARGYRSDIYRASGREYYRNKAGRCEDAPCCGCCNF